MDDAQRNEALHRAHPNNPGATVVFEDEQYILVIRGDNRGDKGYAVLYCRAGKRYMGVCACVYGTAPYVAGAIGKRLEALITAGARHTLERVYLDARGLPVSYVMRTIGYSPSGETHKVFTSYNYDLGLLYDGEDEEKANLAAENFFQEFSNTRVAD